MTEKLSDLLGGLLDAATETPEAILAKYPARPAGQIVTRFGPSPTGFLHIGSAFASLVSERVAHTAPNGIFMLRIEDTDTERSIEGAAELIATGLGRFDIKADEGLMPDGTIAGNYGPYIQSQRKPIYQAFVKQLLDEGKAYPCFASVEDLDALRAKQRALSVPTGYYGKYATWRNASLEQVKEALAAGKEYVIRFKATATAEDKASFHDAVRGDLQMGDNYIDAVIIKSDGLPTYHFAHVVDDHLMGTTHVLRADEWIASVPLHLQMFAAMNWQPPVFGHISAIQKIDEEDGGKRKLSKRKDPEANVEYYFERGYPAVSVKEYLMNIANSDFEPWRQENPNKDLSEFAFNIDKLSKSGALLDMAKLEHISKEVIARFDSAEVYNRLHTWAQAYDEALAARMVEQKDYFIALLAIERDGVDRVRKDFYCWQQAWSESQFYFDDLFSLTAGEALQIIAPKDEAKLRAFVAAYLSEVSPDTPTAEWFSAFKELALAHGYAKNPKEYDKDQAAYQGHIADAANVLRVLLTGRKQTPDLAQMISVMGAERVKQRLVILV